MFDPRFAFCNVLDVFAYHFILRVNRCVWVFLTCFFNGGIKLKFRFHFWLNTSYIQFPFNRIPLSKEKKYNTKKVTFAQKHQMLLRRSKRNPPPKRGGLFFTGRFQKVCQFRLRMYRLVELFRRLPSAIHFYLETIIFPNFMRFQEQKPGILKSVYEVNKKLNW